MVPIPQAVEADHVVVPNLQHDIADPVVVPTLQEEDEIRLTLEGSDDLYRGDCGACSRHLEEFAIICNTCKLAIHPECGKKSICTICTLSKARTQKRKIARDAQEQQAKKMLKRSEAHRPPLLVGDNVRVPIPKVDRGRTDPGNVIGVVTEITEHGSYKVGTKRGQLKGALSRNLVEKCSQNVFLSPKDVPDSELSVRQAAAQESIGHGQGFLHCGCKTGCQNGRCKCKKSNRLCNSRCHPNLSCKNKC